MSLYISKSPHVSFLPFFKSGALLNPTFPRQIPDSSIHATAPTGPNRQVLFSCVFYPVLSGDNRRTKDFDDALILLLGCKIIESSRVRTFHHVLPSLSVIKTHTNMRF